MKKTILLLTLVAGITFCSTAQSYTVKKLNSGITDIFNASCFLNDTVGYVSWQSLSQGGIIKTINGGTNWTKRIISPNPIRSVYFTSIDTGYAVGDDGIFKTTNQGNNWTNIDSGYFRSIYFTSRDTGYAAGNYGNGYGVYKTTNAGATWTNIFNQAAADGLFFITSKVGYVEQVESPYTSFYKTTDAGNTWATINIPGVTNGVISIFFTDLDTGYVGEFEHGIYKTTDGGNTWKSLNLGTPFAMHSLGFINPSVGFAAGSGNFSGLILHTTNGGNTWNILYSDGDSSSVLGGVVFPSPCIGYVSGNMGTMLKIECASGINSIAPLNDDINIFPNPASDNITIESSQQAIMEILNIQGQTVLQQQLQQGKTNIDISRLAKGVYILRLNNNDKTAVTKIVKE
jgi:photosystem II stability/assembly factor-like uncharacterized protein